MLNIFYQILFLPRKLVALIIRVYQLTLSPDHGIPKGLYPHGFCKFYPSCSEYTRLSVLKHGVAKGIMFSIPRIIKCNPFSSPKIDLVK